ncbi:hypothetical protein A2686_00740 [Candidatus Woesebacteria bacterium RIFCSPHIGHO2_01_FULL_38_10]|uniref:Glycosyltransferase 2-like domain-containing protein n=1 Tax=Candidatus Woesebacteria bacterium RIFCSPLOWO2_01_FULL_39_10b TaxID=1802517 RepID=A0A1F8B9C3_9BACT|nr:MAG: hypothetical protein A2686_00740 [Candidatus Woesebacteria bacterium RIFCSPHIGHO2_01_FULL_38_10]OGM60633.1 MAG: hypothetical protein A2892_01135 [Candidatus Woesebacteria bacterium RIFCSPLOWO2_01_FULL_39_10b]
MTNGKFRAKISAIVIGKNVGDKLLGCLSSLQWVDDLVYVDTGSEDASLEIAKNNGAAVFTYKKGGYSDWRNKGLKVARGEWILYVDTDEIVPPQLRGEILHSIQRNDGCCAFAIPRKNIIFGKEMKHCGLWPDYVKRLFLKSKLKKWQGEIHEEPVYEGKMNHLENPLMHYKHDNLSEMLEKTNKWSEIEARLMYEASHPKMNEIRFTTAIMREFWLRIIRQTSFLDGREGVIYGLYQVFSRFLSYAKLWEMQLKTK